MSHPSFEAIEKSILQCQKCSRLCAYVENVGRRKKKAYADQTYHAKGVPGFGDPQAKVWIIGIGPSAHGANRTGRQFTGDQSGLWLYRELFEFGFSNRSESLGLGDGLALQNVFISTLVRCAPIENKPTPEELLNCRQYLESEYEILKPRLTAIVVFGHLAYQNMWDFLVEKGVLDLKTRRPVFQHGLVFETRGPRLILSFHPSQQNTFTGKLKRDQFQSIFQKVRSFT